MSLSINIGRPFLNDKTLDEQARSILRLYGTNAHVYLPGANGVAVSGLLSNNYTLSNGSTGHSTVDGTAGLVLDGAGATVQYNPATLTFFAWEGTGASTIVRAGAQLTFTSAPANDGIRFQPVYSATDTWSSVKFTASGSGSLIVFAGGVPVTFTLTGTPTQYQCGTPGNASNWLIFRSNSAGMSASITINEISGSSGIHATQSTTANKPAVRRGLYNVLKQSNTFTEANWLKTNIALTAGVADPFGGTSATTLTATGVGEIYQTAADAGKPYTSGIYIRRRTGTGTVSIRNAANTAWIPLSLTSAWQLLVNDGGTTTANWYLDLQISTSGDAVDVYGAIVSPGVLSAAQILSEGGIPLTTSTAASNSGAGRYSHQFDGSNDSLLTGNLAITNAVCITIAGRLDSLAATSVLLGEDTGGVSISVATNGAVSFDKLGTGALVTSSAGLIVAGTPFVLTCRLSGGTAVIRKNGTQSASSASGTTFAATTGARLGGTFAGASYCTGALSQIDVIVGAVTDADALTLERNAASNLVAGPTF